MFRLPHALDLQIVPTAVHRLGGQAVYTTHRPLGYPPQDVVSLRVGMGLGHGWTSTSSMTALSAAPARTALSCLLHTKGYGAYPVGSACSRGRCTR